MITRCVVIALYCALLTGCQIIEIIPEADDITFRLNEPFALAFGDRATMEDAARETELELAFVGGVDDTRCPDSTVSDVMCAWSGAVEVEMEATVNGQTETFALIAITDYDGVVLGSIDAESASTSWYFAGYIIELKQVIPYPLQETPTELEDYVTTIVVSQAEEPLPTPTDAVVSIADLVDDTGKPLLCVSEQVLTEWAAGAADDEPLQLTPPLAAQSLPNRQAADQICALAFGEGWRIGDMGDVEGMWAPFVPTDAHFWIGDSETDAVVQR